MRYNSRVGKKRVKTGKVEDSPEIPPDHKAELLPPSPFSGYQLPADKVWKPGVSANPGGAPKGKRISTWLAEFGQQDLSAQDIDQMLERPGLVLNARIALAQLKRAARVEDGLPAAMWAADRVEGGVDRTVHLTHKQEPTMSEAEALRIVKDSEGPALDKF